MLGSEYFARRARGSGDAEREDRDSELTDFRFSWVARDGCRREETRWLGACDSEL